MIWPHGPPSDSIPPTPPTPLSTSSPKYSSNPLAPSLISHQISSQSNNHNTVFNFNNHQSHHRHSLPSRYSPFSTPFVPLIFLNINHSVNNDSSFRDQQPVFSTSPLISKEELPLSRAAQLPVQPQKNA